MHRFALLSVLVTALLFVLSCGDDPPPEGSSSGNNTTAGNGTTGGTTAATNNGTTAATNNGTGTNNGTTGGTNNGTTGGTNNGTTGGTNNGQVCEPGARRCVDAQNEEICSEVGDAWQARPCGEDEVCDEESGSCVARRCEPGQLLGCQSGEQVICNEAGTEFERVPCEEGLRCVAEACRPADETCGDDNDCDSDTFCDRELCVAYPAEPRGDSNGSCIQEPYEGEFRPELQCEWTLTNVIMQPAVADMDGDGTPEIIFTALLDIGPIGTSGAVVIIRGDDCTEVARSSIEEPTPLPEGEASLAVGDIDADGDLEVVVIDAMAGVHAFDHELNHIWTGEDGGSRLSWGGPAIADVDKDGMPEVVYGEVVLNGEDGTVQWSRGAEWYPLGNLTAVADVDLDGDNEIITGNRIWGPNGEDETPAGLVDLRPGHVAIADFDPSTPEPEIVVVYTEATNEAGNRVRVQTIDGEIIFGPYQIPDPQGPGGPPNVGDFDGDQMPEIGTAGGTRYAVFDFECAADPLPEHCEAEGIRWTKATQDASSGSTGSSLFDFEGDGRADVVYNDECFLRVYDGESGALKATLPNTTNTTQELPVVADVDGDFNSEIVVSANRLSGSRCTEPDPETNTLPVVTQGVRVFGDVTHRWVNSRPIWNQHTYHITNVHDDGTIPQDEAPNWVAFNNYRQNLQQEGKALYAPDLTVRPEPAVSRGACAEAVTLTATVANRGSQPVASGVPVSFFDGDPDQGGAWICTARSAERLAPGQSAVISCLWPSPPDGATTVHVQADIAFDDDNDSLVERNTECVEGNNGTRFELMACQ